MNRKPLLFSFGGACLTVLAMGAPSARAQIVVNVDEFATPDPVNSSQGIQAIPKVPDPTLPSGSTPTVGYFLPFPTVPGDLIVLEPPAATTNPPSDLLRFVPQGTGTLLLVYSDFSSTDPPNAPADVGLPPNVQPNVFQLIETGLGGAPYTEDSNGLFYTPTPNQPGGSVTGAPITYNFVSDSVPEPGMLCLTPALAGLLMRNRRRYDAV